MRFLVPTVSFLPQIGGAETGVHNLAEGLVCAGHETLVLTTSLKKRDSDFQHSYAIQRHRLPRGAYRLGVVDRLLAVAIRKAAARFTPDIVLASFAWPIGYAALLSRSALKIPVIIISHGGDIQREPTIGYGMRLDPRLNRKVEWAILNADGLIAISAQIREEFIKIGAQNSKIAQVPYAVDTDALIGSKADARRALGIPDQCKVVLAVGRNHPKKGFDRLVRMVATIAETIPALQVIFVGRNISNLANLARECGASPNIKLVEQALPVGLVPAHQQVPPTRRMSDYFLAADVFALPSVIEGLPVVVIEAMASGLPVVAINAPRARELVKNGLTGRLVPANDARAFSEAIAELLRNETLRSSLGSSAQTVATEFSRETVANRVVQFASKIR